MYENLELRLHATIADNYPTYIKLWYLCRAIDVDGSGVVDLRIDEAQKALGLCKRSILDYLSKGSVLFRAIQKQSKNCYRIYLKSLVNVTLQKGLVDFGGCAFVTTKELSKIKVTATEITAQGCQAASRYLANLQQKNFAKANHQKSSKRALKPEELFNGTYLDPKEEPSSQLCCGALGFNSDHRTLFVKESFIAFGASQPYIANKLGRCRQTISNRLKRTPRIRLAQYSPNNFAEQAILKEEYDPNAGKYLLVRSKTICDSDLALGKTFKLLPLVYYPSYSLSPVRKARSQVKRSAVRLGIL